MSYVRISGTLHTPPARAISAIGPQAGSGPTAAAGVSFKLLPRLCKMEIAYLVLFIFARSDDVRSHCQVSQCLYQRLALQLLALCASSYCNSQARDHCCRHYHQVLQAIIMEAPNVSWREQVLFGPGTSGAARQQGWRGSGA